VVVNGLEESLARVLHAGCWSEVRSFGARGERLHAPRASRSAFDVLRGPAGRRVDWQLGGEHNQLNALAAIAAAEHVGVAPAIAAAGAGPASRTCAAAWKCAARCNGITVYDDFAHHPTAIRTTLDGLRRQVGRARILAVFEPRSNTMKLGTMKAQLPWALEGIRNSR
jgi:UDP-N-acetylmuramate: L-alanyl-gamma-D-glutamyl-meso-diaminopimelate ligase